MRCAGGVAADAVRGRRRAVVVALPPVARLLGRLATRRLGGVGGLGRRRRLAPENGRRRRRRRRRRRLRLRHGLRRRRRQRGAGVVVVGRWRRGVAGAGLFGGQPQDADPGGRVARPAVGQLVAQLVAPRHERRPVASAPGTRLLGRLDRPQPRSRRQVSPP